ncbi:fumarylacetoacetate hydrolase family protein [Melghirimyces profundicolus]|nr:fumarylacetoacetate hydrolase family protein [Melghirimyces profundicolus]
MRLVTFHEGEGHRLGCLDGDRVIDLNRACRAWLKAEGNPRSEALADAWVPKEITPFLQGGEESLKQAEKAVEYVREHGDRLPPGTVHSREAVRLAAPVPAPGKILCVGLNYRDHIREMGREEPEFPVIFAKFANTVIGPGDEIPLPPVTEKLDYEAEFAFVIGRRTKNVSRDEALDYVAGYTIVNDVSARDLQKRTIQWLQGKTLDGSAPMGPCLVTRDEIPDPGNLEIALWVNGEERQRSNTRQLVFDVARLVEFLSELMTLEPGDVICTGTPGGVGFARKPPVFLNDGDRVRIEVESIGVLENRVRAEGRNHRGTAESISAANR